MKDDAVLLNTSRGALMDEAAILNKLETCPNFWVGTDVFANEPAGGAKVPFDNELARHPRVVGTHHVGASTVQSETAIGNEAVRILKHFARTGSVMSCVNMAHGQEEEETFKLTVRHLAGDGVLAHCFQTFMQFGWNVQDLKHVSFDARKACATNVTFKGRQNGKSPEVVAALLANPAVLDVKF